MAECSVCSNLKLEETGEIVSCEKCKIMYHTRCYGTLRNKRKNLCELCSSNKIEKKPECVLCPVATGAFKKTKNDKFIHMVCASAIDGVIFEDDVTLSPVLYDKADKNQFGKKCVLCQKKSGAVIKCFNENCTQFFHATCAQLSKSLKPLQKNGKQTFIGFCKIHKEVKVMQFIEQC